MAATRAGSHDDPDGMDCGVTRGRAVSARALAAPLGIPFANCGLAGPNTTSPVHCLWYYGIIMAAIKVTFSLPPETVGMLNDAADRLSKPKSAVVRDAIQDYYARIDRLSETERIRMLAAFDELSSKLSPRTDGEVDRELEEIRAVRRRGGRLTRVE